ncbi:MAG: SDR family NAD(P)-dependent oxidoreductase, partial [Rhodobacterales bacterium]|nr:SDR family NAD(P)-dependent oxidoreductase [Rhodobacterales bacterium]MDX5500348.1 SDR family NAD(P)-dependent oxidoreductase [Rhodobacterales bacterium]
MIALTGKVAIVAGAARGIGAAIAARFVAAGAQVVLADLPGAGADRTAAALGP